MVTRSFRSVTTQLSQSAGITITGKKAVGWSQGNVERTQYYTIQFTCFLVIMGRSPSPSQRDMSSDEEEHLKYKWWVIPCLFCVWENKSRIALIYEVLATD